MKSGWSLSVCVLAAMAGQAMGQVNGRIDTTEPYVQLWVQNQPTSFGDNIAGSASGSSGDPQNAIYGAEFAIPLSAIGITNGGVGGIKLGGFLAFSGSSVSNQVIALDNLPSNSLALGPGRTVDFQSIAGQQHITIFPQVNSVAPVVDGQLDGGLSGYWAGRRVWLNSVPSSQGNNNLGVPNNANGSEFNALYAVIYNNATPGNPSDDVLYLALTGNFHNFNRVAFFFDSVAGGQNRLRNGNSTWSFGFLSNMSADSPANTNGLRWDVGFEPDYLFNFNAGGSPMTMYADMITIPTDPVATPGQGYYLGNCQHPSTGALGGGNPGPFSGVQLAFNNSNVIGVGGFSQTVTTPDVDYAFGSEIDALYGYVDTATNRLHLLAAGNLETNFNKFVFFFDVDPSEGQNQLRGEIDLPRNPEADFNGLNRMGNGGNGAVNAGPGLKFEPGFTADYFLSVTNGSFPVEVYTNAAVLRANGRLEILGGQADYSAYDGGIKNNRPNINQPPVSPVNDPVDFVGTYAGCQPGTGFIPTTNGAPRKTYNDNFNQQAFNCDANNNIPSPILNSNLIMTSIDNSNVLGVTDVSASGAGSVTKGVELSLNLTELGWNGSAPIKVAGFLVSSNYDVVSNQVIGGIAGGPVPNLGESSAVDFTLLPGTQCVVVPVVGGPSCDSLDFNNDGVSPDTGDIDDFLSVFGGGSCSTDPTPGCNDLDFNNDGVAPDTLDIESFLSVFGGGPCL